MNFFENAWYASASYYFVLTLFIYLIRPILLSDRGYGYGFFEKFFNRRPFQFVLILCGLIIFIRTPAALLRAEFWAEDLTEFFLGALHMRSKSILTPVYGYHFFGERIIAWASTFLPVFWTPYIFVWVCFLISTLASAYFVRDGFSWLVKSQRFRVLLCATIALGPGTNEVHFSFCNLPSPLTWLAALLLLEVPHRLSIKRLATLIFIALSAGQTVLLLPLVATFFWVTKSKKYLLLAGGIAPMVLLNFIGNHQTGSQNGLLKYSMVLQAPQAFIENFFARLLVVPIWGPHNSRFMLRNQLLFWVVSLVGIYFLRKLFLSEKWSLKDKKFRLLFSMFVGFVGLYAVVIISRSYSMNSVFIRYGNPGWGLRYSFLPGCAALVIWFSYLSLFLALPRSKLVTNFAKFVVFLLVANNVSNWNSFHHRQNLNWASGAEKIQEALRQQAEGSLSSEIRVPLNLLAHPLGWAEKAELVLQPLQSSK